MAALCAAFFAAFLAALAACLAAWCAAHLACALRVALLSHATFGLPGVFTAMLVAFAVLLAADAGLPREPAAAMSAAVAIAVAIRARRGDGVLAPP